MTRCIVSGLQALGVYDQIVDGPWGPKKVDAGETAAMARELEYIFAEVYRKEFPDLKGRSLVPIKGGVPSGAESHTYTEVERFGQAKIVHNYAKDFPGTEVQGKQFSDVIRSIGDSYQYSVQDVRASALTKIKMPIEKAETAREVMENLLDDLTLNGDADTNLKGMNSASLVTNYNAVSKGTQASGTTWLTATPQEILLDVLGLCRAVADNTKNKHTANTLVLDSASYNKVAFTFIESATGVLTTQTILQYILANVPGLQTVEVWHRLDHAGATSKSRIFAYDRNPGVIYQVIPQDFEQMPPQARNMAFVINCHMRWGGCVSPRPKAVSYMDGTGASGA